MLEGEGEFGGHAFAGHDERLIGPPTNEWYIEINPAA
jgi:hypothetical protein